MIIGFDASRAFVGDKTGTENYSFQLYKALTKIDKENKYLLYTRNFNNNVRTTLMKLSKNFCLKEINWKWFWTQGGLALQTFTDKLDVLFVPAHTLPLIRKPRLKTVVTVHDLGSEYLPKMHQLKQQLYLKWITHFQLKTATKLIAVSKATKDDLIKRVGCDPEKIKVVYEGYDKKLFKPVKSDLLVNRLRYYGLVPRKYFLFVGTVQPRKNLGRLIKAFSLLSSLRGVKRRSNLTSKGRNLFIKRLPRSAFGGPRNDGPDLVIAGPKGWLSDEIYKLPKKLGIKDKVKFLGYVPEKHLPALYSGAIALTFPSLFEGFGLPILEAQACGCPVLTSNVSSMPEVAGKGALYVNPYSLNDIIRGIREIRGIRGKLIKTGFENIRRFSWKKCAKETLAVLENL